MDTVKFEKGSVKVVAHRGVSGIERENTCPAFVAAGNRSYFGVETDVYATSDGKFALIHDKTTERVSAGAHNVDVEQTDFEEIKKLALPDRDGTFCRRDIFIPSLEEYIRICQKYGKICVLELKSRFKEEELIRMAEEIRQIGYLESVIFISFSFENCVNARRLLPNNKIQWLMDNVKITEEHVQKMLRHRLDLDICCTALDKETVEMLHANGIEVNCWTCDDKETAERLALMGVDYITSNILE